MNKTALMVILVACSFSALAQCDKKIILTSSTTEYLDSNDVVQRSVAEETIIRIDKSALSITPGGREMKGIIKENTCNWTVPFKEGKSTITSTLMDEAGEKNATLNLEAKDGKAILLFELAEMPGRKIRVLLNKFEEDKEK